MANINEKIQNLLKNTSSPEVKAVCESFLNEAAGKDVYQSDKIAEKLFENLKTYVGTDSQVSSLLNEREGYAQSIMNIESQISKNAAQNFAANWDTARKDKKVSNVGNLMDNTLKAENIAKANQSNSLLEKLSTIDDSSAKQFVDKSKIDSYLVKESIVAIKGSQIANHPNIKYVLAKFETALMENVQEYTLVNDFLSQINAFKWDPTVKAATEKIQESINSKATELEVQNTIHAIKSTDNKRFFTDIVGRMNEWVYSDKKNVHELVREMKGYMFNPHIKDLANKLMLMENSKGTQFNIPVKDSNCSVSKIFSPVFSAVNGQVFKAGENFYHSTNDKIKKLSEAQINALPKEFLELCESFFNPSVKVTDDMISVYMGKSKIQFAGDKRIFINEKQIEASSLGSQLMFLTQQTIFRDTSNMANVAMNIYENMDKICEIDYGKAISSTVFEGVGVYLFKKDGTIYINKVNSAMNENKFVKANAIQTVNLVKQFLSFNMSESLGEFLEGDYKKKASMEGDMNGVLSNIQLLEGELDKIEKAILADPSYADVKEIADAKTLLENELNNLKSAWQDMSESLKSFEMIIENDDEEAGEPEEEEEEIVAAPEEETEGDDENGEEGTEDGEGGEPTEPEAPIAPEGGEGEEIPAEPVTEPIAAPVVAQPAGLVDNGLLGAGGAQIATIPGNDHMDANVSAGTTTSDGQVVDAGFAGAAGQHAGTAAMQTSDVIKQETAVQPVITPGEVAPVIAGQAAPVAVPVSTEPAVVAPEGDAVVVDVEAEEEPVVAPEGEEGTDDDNEVKPEGEEEEKKEIFPDKVGDNGDSMEEGKKNTVSESIGVDSKVKDKVTGKCGTVTAINDELFTVLLDDGAPVERKMSDLEDVAVEIEQNIENNEKPIDVANTDDSYESKNENEEAANASGEEGADTEGVEGEEGAMFVKATLTIDLGPFKAGDEVEVDAANYTSTGDDDPVKLKEPKEGVSEIPKKYLTVADNKAMGGTGSEDGDVDAKVAEVLKQIQDLETFLSGKNTKGNKAIKSAQEKIKKFAASLEEPEEENPDAGSEEKPVEEVQ